MRYRETLLAIALVVALIVTGASSAQAEDAPPLAPAAVDAAVLALKRDDVAWRHIEWKTCLLEGIAASRAQKKPIVLWIFIDRPIDDERC